MSPPLALRQPGAKPLLHSQHVLRELLACLALVALPHLANLPLAATGFFYGLLGYRTLALNRGYPMPDSRVLLGLTLLTSTAVYLQSHGVFGHRAGTSLLLAAMGLKVMELRSERDLYLLVALGYLLALTQFLFSQTIPMAFYLLAAMLGLTTVLMGIASGSGAPPLRWRIRQTSKLALQTLPLALLLFLLAPRLDRPFWSLRGETRTLTGLSDHLAPGSVGQMFESDEVAFRVNFTGPPPPSDQLYWRGPVFWRTDGTRWDLAELPPATVNSAFSQGTAVEYSVVLEPHGHKWLLALDWPIQAPPNGKLTGDYRLLAERNIEDRQLYTVRSQQAPSWSPLPDVQRYLALQLPSDSFQALKPLVAAWRERHDDWQVVQDALAYFQTQPFQYTRSPPLLPDRPVERFLLETRQGFCEHYATAFTVLMRLAGIPARIVTGYQGGHWNDVGQFLEVRQSDAHAWSEVWLDDRGWVRVDPTAALAQARRNLNAPVTPAGASQQPGQDNAERAAAATGTGDTAAMSAVGLAWQRAPLIWAAVEHGWHRWVLGYGRQDRAQIFAWLKGLRWPEFMVFGLGLAAVLGWWLLGPEPTERIDQAQACYLRFCSHMASNGLPRRPGEGPMAYGRRLAAALPERKRDLEAITRAYIALRYAPAPPAPGSLDALRRLVNGLVGTL